MADDIERVADLPRLPPRRANAHKGDFGRVLIVGGSRGMPGAVSLAANAALRGGAGLVSFAAPEPVQLTIAGLCPCATSVALACDAGGGLARESVRQFADAAARADVVAVGPGMAVGPGQQNLVRAALAQARPLVIDADGLNNLAAIDGWPAVRAGPAVLTPHPGEFSRLTGRPVGKVQADRQAGCVSAARAWSEASSADAPLVCVLKGAGTVVTDGRRVYVNQTGNPGLATGGTGDVLTGLAAAMLAQGLGPFEAACLAAHCHGRAGDLAAEKLGQASLTAWDLLDFLPGAIRGAAS